MNLWAFVGTYPKKWQKNNGMGIQESKILLVLVSEMDAQNGETARGC